MLTKSMRNKTYWMNFEIVFFFFLDALTSVHPYFILFTNNKYYSLFSGLGIFHEKSLSFDSVECTRYINFVK